MTTAILLLVLFTVLDDMPEANDDRAWLADRWWYAQNRWKAQYTGPPYTWRTYKWWVWIGGSGFHDLWHLLKTLRTLLLVGILAHAFALPWWFVPVGWLVYGIVHLLWYDGALRVLK